MLAGVATQRRELINMAVVSFHVETGSWEDVCEQPPKWREIGVGGSVLIWKRGIVDKERITTD